LRYDNGKINGEVKIFDSTGGLLETQNLYYDLRVGQSIEYKQGRINQYYFYSLENKELLHIDYDSIQGKKIEQLNDTSFFFGI
jgi:antitoxin component YwqK of YwqJK toxin-antitoxin module